MTHRLPKPADFLYTGDKTKRRFRYGCHKNRDDLSRAERRAKGWTQRQLAGELQLTDKAVSRWETGKGLPDVSLLLPLAAALGVSVGELLAGERQPQPPVVQAAETRTAEQLVTYTQELGPQLRRRRVCTVLAGTLLLAAAFLALQFLRLVLTSSIGMAAFGVESLLWLVVLPFVFTTSAFWLLRMLCTDGLAETRAFRRASAMAVAGLWLFYVYCAGAFAGCVAFPVLDFWRTPAWQENVNLVPFRQIVQYLLCLVPGRGYINGGGYAFRGHFAFWMNLFVFSAAGSAAAAHLAPLAWGQSRAVAGRGRRQCDRDYTVVRAHGFRAVPV